MMRIVSGSVKVSNITINGQEAILNFIGARDVSGEITVLDGLERTATAATLEPAETFVIARRDPSPALGADPAALKETVERQGGKLRVTPALVEDSLNEMPGRTARGLLRLAIEHGTCFGLSRENTSRQLGALRNEDVVRMDRTAMLVRGPGALGDAAEEGSA